MTNKEFEAKKQEIIDEVDALNNLGLINNEARAIVINPLNQLQPPRPTCATCDYKRPVMHMIRNSNGWVNKLGGYECKKVKCLKLNSFGDESSIQLPLKGFGCNWHSDYGDAK